MHRDRLDRVVRRDLFSEDVRRQSIVDEDHNPLPLEGSEVSVLLWTFDQAGHAVECRYANTFGSPRPDPNRMYGYRATVDRRGPAVGVGRWGPTDARGRRRRSRPHRPRVRRAGQPGRRLHFGADGKPLVHGEGWSVRRTAYDEVGNLAEEAFRNAEGGPTLGDRGFARVVWAYDERGNVAEELYFAVDGKRTLRSDGSSRLVAGYDNAETASRRLLRRGRRAGPV